MLKWESPLIYSVSIKQIIWEYISGNESPLIYSFSIKQIIWEYISEKKKLIAGEVHIVARGGDPPLLIRSRDYVYVIIYIYIYTSI